MHSQDNGAGSVEPGFTVQDSRQRDFGFTYRQHMDTPEYRALKGKTAVAVLHLLSTYASPLPGPLQNACYPKQKTLAEVLGVSRETVNRAISQLEKQGFVKRSAALLTGRSGKTVEVVVYSLLSPPSCRPPAPTLKPAQ